MARSSNRVVIKRDRYGNAVVVSGTTTGTHYRTGTGQIRERPSHASSNAVVRSGETVQQASARRAEELRTPPLQHAEKVAVNKAQESISTAKVVNPRYAGRVQVSKTVYVPSTGRSITVRGTAPSVSEEAWRDRLAKSEREYTLAYLKEKKKAFSEGRRKEFTYRNPTTGVTSVYFYNKQTGEGIPEEYLTGTSVRQDLPKTGGVPNFLMTAQNIIVEQEKETQKKIDKYRTETSVDFNKVERLGAERLNQLSRIQMLEDAMLKAESQERRAYKVASDVGGVFRGIGEDVGSGIAQGFGNIFGAKTPRVVQDYFSVRGGDVAEAFTGGVASAPEIAYTTSKKLGVRAKVEYLAPDIAGPVFRQQEQEAEKVALETVRKGANPFTREGFTVYALAALGTRAPKDLLAERILSKASKAKPDLGVKTSPLLEEVRTGTEGGVRSNLPAARSSYAESAYARLLPKGQITTYSGNKIFGTVIGGVQRSTQVVNYLGRKFYVRSLVEPSGKRTTRIYKRDSLIREYEDYAPKTNLFMREPVKLLEKKESASRPEQQRESIERLYAQGGQSSANRQWFKPTYQPTISGRIRVSEELGTITTSPAIYKGLGRYVEDIKASDITFFKPKEGVRPQFVVEDSLIGNSLIVNPRSAEIVIPDTYYRYVEGPVKPKDVSLRGNIEGFSLVKPAQSLTLQSINPQGYYKLRYEKIPGKGAGYAVKQTTQFARQAFREYKSLTSPETYTIPEPYSNKLLFDIGYYDKPPGLVRTFKKGFAKLIKSKSGQASLGQFSVPSVEQQVTRPKPATIREITPSIELSLELTRPKTPSVRPVPSRMTAEQKGISSLGTVSARGISDLATSSSIITKSLSGQSYLSRARSENIIVSKPVSISEERSLSSQRSRVVALPKSVTKPVSKQRNRSVEKTLLRGVTSQTVKSEVFNLRQYGFSFPRGPPGPPGTPGGLPFFVLPGGSSKKGKKKKLFTSDSFRFTPSVESIAFNIVGPKPPEFAYRTGLILRPLLNR